MVVAEAIFAAEGDAAATFHHNELTADVIVAESQRVRQSDLHAVVDAARSSAKAGEAASSPIQRVLVARGLEQA